MSLLPDWTGARRAPFSLRVCVRHGAALLLATVALIFAVHGAQAQDGALAQTDISGPVGSRAFGEKVYTLPNGNFVVVDSLSNLDEFDRGAVWLYDGATLEPIGVLRGSTAGDRVGSGGVVVLTNGNFVVISPAWDNGATVDAGAVTWLSGVTGTTATVSNLNSLVGSSAGDAVGSNGVTALTNGNYVVSSPDWNPIPGGPGAVTWGNGAAGTVGAVSASNSLVYFGNSDKVGYPSVTPLTNGNYVVVSPYWDGAVFDVGAVIWGNGAGGTVGAVSAGNSLVGSKNGDLVGAGGVTALTNGNYVVNSPSWDGTAANVGAVTWGDGAVGTKGVVSASNSLVGSAEYDSVGSSGVTALTNGNYVVNSPAWDNGATANAGAVTWLSGVTGTTASVSSLNSLVGSKEGDAVGSNAVTALTNGNYVVSSPSWAGTAANVGAVTWGNGAGGTFGPVLASNSLVGSAEYDGIGLFGVTALTNGNYVVSSPYWNGAASYVGAVTWGNGAVGTVGPVTESNSLVGSKEGDAVGISRVTALTNGNYVVISFIWTGAAAGAPEQVGAVTWGDGAVGTKGVVSESNSLVGSSAGDSVGISGVTALTNGNYVVNSESWIIAPFRVGAVTWGNGAVGTVGPVTESNSLVGSGFSNVGTGGVTALTNGNYVVNSPDWGGLVKDNGAVSLGNGRIGTSGEVTSTNTVLGESDSGGSTIVYAFDAVHQALVVGRPADNIVTVAALRWTLTVTKAGNGAGSVTSAPAGIDCGATCALPLNDNQVYTLTATPATGSTFTGWSGDCAGTGVCALTTDRTHAVTATFTLNTFPLTVSKAGNGSGSVNGVPANPAAINVGTVVTLTATPATGSTFTGWSGACTGTASCIVTMTQARSVTATFTLNTFEVGTPPASTGGTVTVEVVTPAAAADAALFAVNVAPASEASVNALYPYGTVLKFTAVPAEGYLFSAWGGSLSGSQNPTQVTVTGPLGVTASFVLDKVYLYLPTIEK